MPDLKPPRLVAGERATIMALLQYQRDSVVRKVADVDASQAAQSPVASGTSLLWLVAHLARAESTWIEERFAGATPSASEVPPATLPEAVEAYRATWVRVDAIAQAHALDATCAVDVASPSMSLRWVLLHLLEETARHAGHADVLRELLDGVTGR